MEAHSSICCYERFDEKINTKYSSINGIFVEEVVELGEGMGWFWEAGSPFLLLERREKR